MSEIRKEYQIKSYSFDGTFKSSVNPSLVMNDLTFSMNINGGYGQMKVSLALPISNDQFQKSDVIEVYCFDPENINGRLIYRGILTRLTRTVSNKGEFITITCLGMFSMLNRLVFISGTAVFTKDQEPDQTIKDVIDYFNSIYTAPRFSYSGGHIQPFGDDISLDFDYTKCGESINNIQKATADRFFFIDVNGDVRYQSNGYATTNHRLKITQEIDNFIADEEVETVTNQLFLRRKSGVSGGFNDPTSQANYGRIDTVLSSQNVENLPSAILFGDAYINENKNEKREIKLNVNSNYDIESIKPGHTITILNTEYETVPLQVQKVNYSYDKITVELDRYSTFAESIFTTNMSG